MKGRHKVGDTLMIEAKVTAVDEGDVKAVVDENGIQTGWTGDTHVLISINGKEMQFCGSQLPEAVAPITEGEPEAEAEGNESTDTVGSTETASTETHAGAAQAESGSTDATLSEAVS